MIKIVALNDEDEDETNEEEELVATREAQETIAESEYIRAIKLKSEGEVDLCLHLLKELLQTQVLNENTSVKNNRNDKLWNIKYNCHKNIAFILEERSEYMLALQHYISAILIDNTDVSTLHKFGQLALKLNVTDLAEYAFENCLGRNAAHWCAAEGMLEVMNINHNIMGSFSCATKILQQDVNSEKAEETLKEIKKLFGQNLSLLKNCNGIGGPGIEMDEDLINNNEFRHLFDSTECLKEIKQDICDEKPDLKEFYIKHCNWQTIGEFIVKVYAHLKKIEHNMLFTFNFNDIIIDVNSNDEVLTVISKDITEVATSNGETLAESSAGEQQDDVVNTTETAMDQAKPVTSDNTDTPQPMEFNNNEDSDSNAKSDGGEVNKSKPKRRCSDLHFLEQWGWHKNRRYSSRKKNERDEIDTSLNGYLRKIFEKYTNTVIEDKWPFSKELNEVNNITTDTVICKECKIILTEDEFNEQTKEDLEKFINNLKEQTNIDLMEMVYKWLKYISSVWFLPLPEELKSLYVEIFEIYTTHFSFSSWQYLTPNNYEACYRICLLFLELEAAKNHIRNDSNSLWYTVFHNLLFNLGNFEIIAHNSDNINNNEIYKLKLIILEYLQLNKEERIKECVSCLQQMSNILDEQDSSFVLHLPNLSNICCINHKYIKNLELHYKRQIDINSIPKLYEQQAWDKLQNIIINNLQSVEKNKNNNEAWLKDICAQIKILLQSFWLMESYENCLLWSEKCLHFAVSSYLQDVKTFYRCSILSQLINFINSYLEAIILNEGFHIVNVFSKEDLARLIHNIIRILVYQFDGTFEKNSNHGHELNFKRSWVILHQLLHKEENDSPATLNNKKSEHEVVDVNELIPKSFLLLFTAHDYLGKRQWCTDDNGEFLQYVLDAVVLNLKAPIYDNCRDVIYEYLEQVTYCLFKYPQKKARQRHLEDHEATQIKLCWPKAVQIFDLYRPEDLPEFNSYKLESITSDMEQLLIKILTLMPKELDPSKAIHHVTLFIEGQADAPSEANAFKLPYKILSLYYLLADYYFKNRDFLKAIKFYTLDLAVNPTRYDSWAGIALSKASKIETKLNGLDPINMDCLWEEYEEVLRCFECCININRFQALLWIEHGSFSYTIHSCFSRYLKSNKDNISADAMAIINERKEKTLSIAYNCFKLANSLQNAPSPSTTAAANGVNAEDNNEEDDGNDEKWLCQYMLGKISEKRKEEPKVYLNHYLMAANYLYESSATYPIKINHNNPTTLSVEALEVFYRINAAMIKYLQTEKEITRTTGDLFRKILKNLSNSPFAYNKAKIDGNSLNILKGKILNKFKPNTANDNIKPEAATNRETTNNMENIKTLEDIAQATAPTMVISSGTSSVMSSDSSTVESDSDSDDDSANDNSSGTLKAEKLKLIYRMVVQNIEECATRFPEHYKSIYRLIYHYMNAPKDYCDLTQSEQLLIGQYKTSLGNLVNGLFYDRKNNNLFNGIWRIPSSEIDRPGSFSAHLVKCVKIFILQLYKTNNHALLLDLAMNLYKTPDLDKRYITDNERKELCNQSINYCVQILRSVLHKNMEKRDDAETLNLLIDIYKIHKKCIKYMNQKEPLFAELLVEVYKYFIKNKVDYIPDNCNFLDLAIKLCVQEITAQKNLEKSANADSDYIISQSTLMQQYGNSTANRVINIPGLSNRPKYRSSTTKTSTVTTAASSNLSTQNPLTMPIPDFTKNPQFLSMFGVFGSNSGNPLAARDTPEFKKLFEEFYAKIIQNTTESINPPLIPPISYNPLEQQTLQSNLLLPHSQTQTTNSNLQESTIYTQSVNNEEIRSDVLLQNQLIAQGVGKQQNKPKGAHKNKSNVFKPYTRPDNNQNTGQETAASSNYKIDMFSNPANVLAAYSNLLQNTNLTQIDFSNKNLTSNAAKKSKVNLPESSSSYLSNLNMAVKERQFDAKPPLPYNIHSTSFATTMQSRNQFTPHHQQNTNSPNTVSPTKTLQEKLAERQKAYQLNENNSKATTVNVDSSNDDVIVLD